MTVKIISIDPGYERVGIAVLEKETGSNKENLLYSDCFQTSPKLPFSERLKLIGTEIEKLIEKYKPERMALELLFFNSNQKTAMGVAEARGAIKYAALKNNLEIFEYSPLQIKIAITGYGKGDKKQITAMVGRLIEINKEIKYDDEYDAIAVGLTYFAINPVK
ncbi:MAG: crossover junction endodeoxyribonuclease RuvC [Candidatus Pacebacteria bacterium]|nr:crossover junction endodeoxyribonuclease RuvC [Candidatus Paceibacterota bacterium]